MMKYDSRLNRMNKRVPRDIGPIKVEIKRRQETYTTEDGRTLTQDEYCDEFNVVMLSPHLTDHQRERNARITDRILHGEDDY